MMTKKHFKAIAAILSTIADRKDKHRITEEFCHHFYKLNPRFDADKFFDAVMGKE